MSDPGVIVATMDMAWKLKSFSNRDEDVRHIGICWTEDNSVQLDSGYSYLIIHMPSYET